MGKMPLQQGELGLMTKPYQMIPIVECGEGLVEIPENLFSRVTPHPYQALGAPYGSRSPYLVRQSVLNALIQAQQSLQQQHPTWQIQIFDAYRPIPVQQFMVEHTFSCMVRDRRQTEASLTFEERQAILAEVHQFWALPSSNPATPPPHSTGAAVDLTLADQHGHALNLGSEIDECSPRSQPHHYQHSTTDPGKCYHHRRQVLYQAMTSAGFQQHPNEWWHFSLGDQFWSWLQIQNGGQVPQNWRHDPIFNPQPDQWIARYGAVSTDIGDEHS